jgi:capsular exopolysaccharide synthesis family protein
MVMRKTGNHYDLVCQSGNGLDLFQPRAMSRAPVTGREMSYNGRTRDEILRLIDRLFAGAAGTQKMIAVAATEHGNGCTWLCAHLGEALAAVSGGAVCLVDANLRSPALHRYMGVSNERGLAEALIERESILNYIHAVPGKDLWVVPAGIATSDLHGLARAEALRARLTVLCCAFDRVVIDAPPVNVSADALLLGGMSDGVVLVIEANATRREAARGAKNTLESAGVRVLGAVLNKRTYPIPEVLYKRI